MKKVIILLFVTILLSCINRNNIIFRPAPDFWDEPDKIIIPVENIIESKSGQGNENLPEWLLIYINYGIHELENSGIFPEKYSFIESAEGRNFDVLNKWITNFSVSQDFRKQPADRIERKMLSVAALYPDDEYGLFFEEMIKKAFNKEYTDAVIEDTYWIMKKSENNTTETYIFYILINIDKKSLQDMIFKMTEEVLNSVTPARQQRNSIRRLQQNFFEGF